MAEPVYIRVNREVVGRPGVIRTYLFEIEPNGYVPREVAFDAEGKPTYITRSGEYPISDYPAPPGSAGFEEQFGSGERITASEFEAAFALADAALD